MIKYILIAISCLFFVSNAKADFICFDGDTQDTMEDGIGRQRYYECWWAPSPCVYPHTTIFTNTAITFYSAPMSGRWTSTVGDGQGGGGFVLDRNWAGVNVTTMTSFEFVAKGSNGGESVHISFNFKTNSVLGFYDGTANVITLAGLTTSWKKFKYSTTYLTNGHHLDLSKLQYYMFSSGGTGTIYFDDMIIRTGGSPARIILNGDAYSSTAHINGEVTNWYGDLYIKPTNNNPISGANCEKLTWTTNASQTVVFNFDWAHWDISGNSKFEFYIRGQSGGESITVQLFDGPQNYANSIVLTGLSTSWTKITRSMFSLTNGSHFTNRDFFGVLFTGSGSGTVFIDDMQFPKTGQVVVNNTRTVPLFVTNNKPNAVRFMADAISSISTTNIASVLLNLSQLGGSAVTLMSNIGNKTWGYTYIVTNNTPSKVYYLPVTATNIKGEGYTTNIKFIVTRANPTIKIQNERINPTNVILNNVSANLSFVAQVTGGIIADVNIDLSPIGGAAGKPMHLTNMTTSTPYVCYYQAPANLTAGQKNLVINASDVSASFAFKSLVLTVIDKAAPSAVNNLTVSQEENNGGLKLQWDAASDETAILGYKIYRGTETGNYTDINFVGNVTSYVDSNVAGGKTYFYAVTAVDTSNNESPLSTEAKFETTIEGLIKIKPNYIKDCEGVKSATIYVEILRDNSNVEITVYDIIGEKVKSFFSGTLNRGAYPENNYPYTDWNLDNDSGKPVPTGVYFVMVKINSDKPVIKKVMVVRCK